MGQAESTPVVTPPDETVLTSCLPYLQTGGAALALCLVIDLLRRLLLQRHSFAGKHVLITGGSQGIGKALAAKLLARGARVTLLARTEVTLQKAKQELLGAVKPGCDEQFCQYVCASITDSGQLAKAVAEAVKTFGDVDVLVACAGAADPGLFLHTSADDFGRAMDLNYVGTVRSIKAVVDRMVARRSGQIIVVGSAMSVVGFMGYSSYAPAKHALRGLTDCLRNELVGFNIAVQIAYPPDTQTPGFEHENKTKPIETLKMVPVDIYSAESVAESMLRGAERGLYHLPAPDPGINVLVSSTAGVTPRGFPLCEALLSPLFCLVGSAVSTYFNMWGHRYARRHESERKAAESQ
mmetsp:Transcript_19990/g.50849  ORF Transcript_19990/g.50849 Transcript_19990/m.50849 type:complete len:352 (-) Transcript_19990:496-1551(-)